MDSFGAIKFEVLTARPRITGSRIGQILEIIPGGIPVVDFPGNLLGPRQARWVASLLGRELERACREAESVLLVFEDNDPLRPVIVDVVLSGGDPAPGVCTVRVLRQTSTKSSLDKSVLVAPVCTFKLAHVIGIEEGKLIVEPINEAGSTMQASTTVPLRNLKDPVLLLQVDAGPTVVIGQLMETACFEDVGDESAELVIKGKNVRIEAGSMLTLKAGSCTLELDARGRAVLVGDQIVSRARVSNKVQGGSVQLN